MYSVWGSEDVTVLFSSGNVVCVGWDEHFKSYSGAIPTYSCVKVTCCPRSVS